MNRAKYPVERMCKLLEVSRSAYYNWLKKGKQSSHKSGFKKSILVVFEKSKRTYGSPRIYEELKQTGIKTSRSTVARAMKELQIQARPKRKYVNTTDSKHGYRVFENKLNRKFETAKLNTKWVSDITYIPTQNGWAYLTIIMDLADRMIVGWSLSKDMTAKNTVIKALASALFKRKITSKLLFHSDRGVQFCCNEFRMKLQQTKLIEQSMSRKGNCWDNAPAESFFKTLKTEWTRRCDYKNYNQAKASIFDYIERWYNTKRKHSSVNYMSPLQKFYFLTNKNVA